jgi:hypothetical protein
MREKEGVRRRNVMKEYKRMERAGGRALGEGMKEKEPKKEERYEPDLCK